LCCDRPAKKNSKQSLLDYGRTQYKEVQKDEQTLSNFINTFSCKKKEKTWGLLETFNDAN
jgi:hypothetical protein